MRRARLLRYAGCVQVSLVAPGLGCSGDSTAHTAHRTSQYNTMPMSYVNAYVLGRACTVP